MKFRPSESKHERVGRSKGMYMFQIDRCALEDQTPLDFRK